MAQPDDKELREDLAATSESVEDAAERLVDIEHTKQSLDAADPLVDALSIEAERLALEIQQGSRIERDLADEIENTESPGPSN